MKKRIIFDLIIIFILGLIPVLWLKDNTVLLGHDAGMALNPVVHFLDRLHVWSQRFSIGTDQSAALLGAFLIHSFEAFLAWLGLSLHTGQIIQFIFWFTTPGLSMYFFAHKIWPEKKYLPLIASVIYMINFYLIQGWFIAERTKFSIYTATPLVLYFLIAYLTKRIGFFKSVLLSGIVLGIFNGGGSWPLYGGLIFAILVSYVYINFIYHSVDTLKRTFFYSVGLGIVYLLLNAYWIAPYFFYLSSFYNRDLASGGGVEGAIAWSQYLSSHSTFINIFRGQGIPDWYLNLYHAFSQNFLNNPILILVSFLFPILAFASLLLIKQKRDKFYIYLLVLMALVAILFSAGPQSQLGIIYEVMVKYVPGFVIFRSAFFKFDYILWFSYGLLIGFTLDSLFSKIELKYFKKHAFLFSKVILIVFIATYVLYHYPILTGSFLDYSREPGKELTTRVKVPDYILEFGKWVNAQDPNKRYLVMPQLSSDTSYISYQWKYWSLAPVTSLLTGRSFVHNTAFAPQTERFLMEKMYSAFVNKDMESFKDLADVFAIDGIVLQKDYDWKNKSWGTVNPEVYEKILDSNSLFSLDKTFGQWKVYSLTDRKKSLRINSTTRLSFLQGELSKIVSFPYFNSKAPLRITDSNEEVNNYYANNATELFLASECIQCNLEYREGTFTYYNPRILPGSFLYPIVTLKEQRTKKRANDFMSLFNYYLTVSDRRIIEAKWMVDSKKSLKNVFPTLERYYQTLHEFKLYLSKEEWDPTATQENKMSQLVMNHLLQQVNIIDSMYKDENIVYDHRRMLALAYSEILDIKNLADNKLWATEDTTNKKYIFDLPKVGKYDVYVKKGSLANPDQDTSGTEITIRNYDKPLKVINEVGGWLSFGTIDLPSKKTLLSLKDGTVKNLLTNVSLVFPDDQKGITQDSGKFALSTDSVNKCFYYQLSDLEIPVSDADRPNWQYIVSFNYRNYSDIHNMSFFPMQEGEQFNRYNTKDSSIPKTRFFKNYTKLITPKASRMRIYFCNSFVSIGEAAVLKDKAELELLPPGQTLTEIRDIKFLKVSYPDIVFYKKQKDTVDENFMTDFTKKDPVTYDINLKSTNQPVSLIMRESYAKYWQVCDEKKKCMPFDDKSHFASAGFANAWYFDKGIGKHLTIYYYPQKMFIIGSIVTITSLILIIGGVCLLKLKRK